MSGKGPATPNTQSQNTKPLEKHHEEVQSKQHNNTDAHFKKTNVVVGKPGLVDTQDDAIKNPPQNLGGKAVDSTLGSKAEQEAANDNQPNTVEAKPVEEIKERIGQKD